MEDPDRFDRSVVKRSLENPNIEIGNKPKPEFSNHRNSAFKCHHLRFWHLDFGRLKLLGFRASDFGFSSSLHRAPASTCRTFFQPVAFLYSVRPDSDALQPIQPYIIVGFLE